MTARLVVVCDADGCVTDALIDDVGVLGREPIGRPLSRALVPSGIASLVALLGELDDGEVVGAWSIEFQEPRGPVVYHCGVTRAGDTTLIAGAREPLTDTRLGQLADGLAGDLADGLAETDKPARAAVVSMIRRIAARVADKDACMADARRQLAVLQAQTKLPGKMENELIRMAAHDLRNPLLVIKMNCSFLLQQMAIDSGMLEDMLDTCEYMDRFLDGMTSLARVWVGELDLQRQPVDGVHLMRELVRHVTPMAATRDITVGWASAATGDLGGHVGGDMGADAGARVYVDERKFTRVLHELFSNALRFCPAGSTVTARVQRTPEHVIFTVEDNGPGILASARAHLFQPFGKGNSDGTWGHGAGVGLAIARRVIEAHGGVLRVHSEPGQGTRVAIELPLS